MASHRVSSVVFFVLLGLGVCSASGAVFEEALDGAFRNVGDTTTRTDHGKVGYGASGGHVGSGDRAASGYFIGRPDLEPGAHPGREPAGYYVGRPDLEPGASAGREPAGYYIGRPDLELGAHREPTGYYVGRPDVKPGVPAGREPEGYYVGRPDLEPGAYAGRREAGAYAGGRETGVYAGGGARQGAGHAGGGGATFAL
ncbi:hypothetical protein TorRG33x02_167680 [Trema orientale]|uniref:Glycine rich protein n=1 Tax=Trema orientale TaxID=63057 RepID=A0A2P5EPL5_TREOI|nr:hypothetical protein TorRG33x02_167680 [Trema orientale]